MSRTVKEWIGATDDSPVPPRVRTRVFIKHGGVCHISGIKILTGMKWECDHIIPLIAGGKNAESNLAPALVEHHRRKTSGEVAQKSKEARLRAKHIGAAPKKPPSKFKRKINGQTVLRTDT